MEYFISIINFFNSHWLVIAFLAPMFWAAVNIVDVYFVEGIYNDEFDGAIISGLFQIIPFAIALGFLRIDFTSFFGFGVANHLLGVNYYLLLAIIAGIFFNSSFYFYYKALFHHNDVALLQIFWGLTIVLVPLLSLFFGDYLSVTSYLGMGIVLIGTTILSLNKKSSLKFFGKYFGIMFGAVFFLSLSMILSGKVYEYVANNGFGNQGFLLVFACFALGAFLSGLFLAIFKKRNPTVFIKKYWKIFLLLEGVTTLGNFTSQRAIDIAPSVSFVATIETFVSAFVLLFSLLILFFVKYFHKGDKTLVKEIYNGQLSGVWVKILAIIIMSIGVYIIS